MEDKSFDLLTKMYGEITDRLDRIDKKLDTKADKSDIAMMENDLKPKVEIALEGYQAVFEKLTTVEDKIDKLTTKVDDQDIQISFLKGSKAAI